MELRDLRLWRSPYSHFYPEETLRAAGIYTAGVLRGIADAGFNAIWIHTLLRQIVPSRVFPEFGRGSAARLASLRTVIRRASRCGLKVYLYMQPPRGLPATDSFWRRHPETAGATFFHNGRDMVSLCTSAEPVRRFLRESSETLSREAPDLGGAILITASEFVAHCYAKYPYLTRGGPKAPAELRLSCPRCAARHPSDIVVEVIRSVRDGFHAAGNGAEVIAWNWGWNQYERDPNPMIVDRLPKDVRLLIDFEKGGHRTILGVSRRIEEYSLGYPGPCERFLETSAYARKRGLRVMAKLQIGTTHELATTPSLPLIGSLFDKAKAMRRLRVRGFLGCWNFGNMLTANTAAFIRFMDLPRLPPKRAALIGFARDYLPGADAARVAESWEGFAQAMESYPFSVPFLYWSPMNYALEYPILPGPLAGKPMGRSWLPDPRGDDLSRTLPPYTLDEVIECLDRLWRGWQRPADVFVKAVSLCRSRHAREEANTVRVVGHAFRSCWNVYRAWSVRREWEADRLPELLEIMRDECSHLRHALRIVAHDRRMGFHSECQRYMFTAAGIRRKLRRMKAFLDRATAPKVECSASGCDGTDRRTALRPFASYGRVVTRMVL